MNMNKKTIKDVDLKGKKVFCRVDYNVPFDENMNITNDTRILATVPTVTYLLEQGAAVILACHIGRPSEAREDKFSTKHILKRLSEVFKQDVKWAPDCVGPEAEKAAAEIDNTKKAVKKINSTIEKTTLGDISELAALKDKLEKGE